MNLTEEEIQDKKSKFLVSVKAFATRAKAKFSVAFSSVSSAIYPENITCDVCKAELVADTRYRLCAKCAENMPFNDQKKCLICGAPMENEADYCLRCQNNDSVFKKNRSPLVYEGLAKKLILQLKFGGKKYLATTLATMMADTFLKEHMEADVIVPVPMSKAEEKKRGFNQSSLIAYELGARLGRPVLPALIKNRETSQQKALTAKDRSENLKGAFVCIYKEVSGLKVLLVDDVFTTGATANECARALYKSRAKEVNVLTAAITKLKIFME